MLRRSEGSSNLLQLTNQELARAERTNNRARKEKSNQANMGDNFDNQPPPEAQTNAATELQNMQQQIQLLIQMQQQMQQQRQHRTIGEVGTPHTFYQNRSAICPPEITRQDYEIKPQMIALVKQHLFYGLPAESPMDHIENYEEICSTTRSNGVPPEWLKCKLFHFSLADKALRWLKSLPPRSFTTWEESRAAFLDNFYTKAKTTQLRNKIANFNQHSGESFGEAWERLKEYRRECPHHGYSDEQFLSIFYDGVEWDFKNALNAASNGDFMTKSIEGAYQLIDNLAASSNNRSQVYDRSKKINSVDSQKIEELNAKMNLLLKANQRSLQMCEDETNEFCPDIGNEAVDEQQEINYVQNRPFNQNYRSHPNLSYRSQNVENPQDQVYPQPMVSQGQPFQGKPYVQSTNIAGTSQGSSGQQNIQNQALQKPFNPNYQGYNRYQGSYPQKQPFNNFQQTNPILPPAVNIPNPQDELKNLMQKLCVKVDSMYNDLNNKFEAVSTHMKVIDTQVAQTAEAMQRPQGALPGKSEKNPRDCNAITLRSGKELEPVVSKASEEDAVIDLTENEKGAGTENKETTPRVVVDVERASERVYMPKVPYPIPPKKSRRALETAKCKEFLADLHIKLPLVDALQMMPSMKSYMKGLVTNKVTKEDKVMMVTKDCSAILQNKLPKKEDDPGKFVLSVRIGALMFACSLCDLGSSVNLMPYSVAKRLGFTKFKETRISLVFADRSVKLPIGVLEDIHVKIGNAYVPADFVVLELEEEPKDPLILGRPFLKTVGAIIDVKNGRIDLHLGDMVMRFEMDKMLKRPMLDGKSFMINDSTDVADETTEETTIEDPLETELTRCEDEHTILDEEESEYKKMLDSSHQIERMVSSISLEDSQEKVTTPLDNPWSELKSPKAELKILPVGLRYAFLGPNSTYPVIINANLNNVESALLLCELRKYRKAIGYSLGDLTGISPDLCMHRIHLEDDTKTSIEHQRRLNPNLKEVVKKEIMKLLEAGIIYAISDSVWVSPVHVVPKKGGVTVVKNDKNELIPTRTVTGHRMCTDYRKLNSTTRKDHFPLPFIDQMLERLSNYPYYCF